ncbi:MAG: hypothetical protein JKX85_06115 [Phycisphaeraceae bacterium]|nr:hypothetical protein [Phycisphaeraceae bacterium]
MIGALAVHTVDTQVRQYKLARPIPSGFEMSSSSVEVLDDEDDDELDVEVSDKVGRASAQTTEENISTPQ